MFYVYELVDPRDGSVFYVGKGKGNRKDAHAKEAKKGKPGLKCDRIRAILAASCKVEVRIVKEFSREGAAFRFERKHIAKLGLESLTNVAAGGLNGFVEGKRERLKEARLAVRSLARTAHLLSQFRDLVFRWGGVSIDIPRDRAIKILSNGVFEAEKVLGRSDCEAEFLKYNVRLRDREATSDQAPVIA